MLATKGTVLAITAVLIVLALSISVYQGGQPAILTRYSTSQRAPNKNVAWGREKDVPSHDLTVFTVSTSISPELQFLISSSPYNVNVLGMGDKFEKYRSKALLLLQAIRCAMRLTHHAVPLSIALFWCCNSCGMWQALD
jgi:hypothetical protein